MDGRRAEAQTGKIAVNVTLQPLLTATFDERAAKIADVETIWYHWHEPGLWLLEGVGPEAAMIHMANKIGLDALASRYEQIVARRKDDQR